MTEKNITGKVNSWNGPVIERLNTLGLSHNYLASRLEEQGFSKNSTFRFLSGKGDTSTERLKAMASILGLELSLPTHENTPPKGRI